MVNDQVLPKLGVPSLRAPKENPPSNFVQIIHIFAILNDRRGPSWSPHLCMLQGNFGDGNFEELPMPKEVAPLSDRAARECGIKRVIGSFVSDCLQAYRRLEVAARRLRFRTPVPYGISFGVLPICCAFLSSIYPAD